MVYRFVRICAIAFACVISINYSTRAEENSAPRKFQWIREVINHSEDLNLNAEQKAKLNDLLDAPAPKSRPEYLKIKEKVQTILTKDQWEKIEGVLKKSRDERPHNDDNDDHK